MLQFYSAMSGAVNPRRAVAECIENALEGQSDTDCSLLYIHATVGHRDFRALLDEAKKMCPSAQIVGCSCAGVIGKGGANENLRALAIMAIKGDSSDFAVASHENIQGHNSYEVALEMAKSLKSKSADIKIIHLLASGIDIAGDRVIEGFEAVFGKTVPIIGGTSADNMRAISTFQWVGTRVLELGAVAVGFADPTLRLVSRAHHGNAPIGMPYEITRAEANRVYELNGKPAWPFLMSELGLDVDVPFAQTIPLTGLGELLPAELHDEYDNKHSIRTIFKRDKENKSFYLPVHATEGKKLWLTQRDEKLIFDGCDRMMKRLVADLGGQRPVAVFHTDCGARGRLLFNSILKDEIVTKMRYPLVGDNDVPWCGIYGFGEFTPLAGRNYFHQMTSSIYALVRN
jgi:hypothetical protein